MRNIYLAIGFSVSIVLSLFIGYRQGVNVGFEYTEKINDADHATGLLRTNYESAFSSYICYSKLKKAEGSGNIEGVKEEEKEFSLYSIEGFRQQAKRIRTANQIYSLLEIYEPHIDEMEAELLK